MEIGGLHIIGSERHESRRIDRQLRGRSGRQGDPGASQFFLSLEDDLMRLFGSERIAKLMDRLGAQEGEVLTHPLITRSIEQAQKRVELQNFQARKRLLDYDDVMNQQREVIYSLRSVRARGRGRAQGRSAEDDREGDHASRRDDARRVRGGDAVGFRSAAAGPADALPAAGSGVREARPPPDGRGGARERVAVEAAKKAFWAKLESLDTVRDEMGTPYGDRLLSLVMLNVLDEKWKDHLYDLDQLRNAIHYRSWGQKDPLIEYKQEAYTMFVDLMNDIYNTFSERFLKVQLVFEPPAPPPPPPQAEADEALQRARHPRGRARGRRQAAGDRMATDAAVDIGPAEPPRGEAGHGAQGSGDRRRRPTRDRCRAVRRRRRTSTGRPSAATIRVRAARGRSSRSATGRTSEAAPFSLDPCRELDLVSGCRGRHSAANLRRQLLLRRRRFACLARTAGKSVNYSRVAPIGAAARAARRPRSAGAQQCRAARDSARVGRRRPDGAAVRTRRPRRRRRGAAPDCSPTGGRAHDDSRGGNGSCGDDSRVAGARAAHGGSKDGRTARRSGRRATSSSTSRRAWRICRSRSSTSPCSTRSIGSSATSR